MKTRIICILLLAAAMAACNKPGPHVVISPAVEAEEAVIADSDDKPAAPAHAAAAAAEALKKAHAAAATAEALKRLAQSYKGMLWSDNCKMATVTVVEKWWKSLSDDDKKVCGSFYNFAAAIPTYKEFFNAKEIDDLLPIQNGNRKYFFSPKQQAVLYNYTKNNKTFNNIKNLYGIEFAGPIMGGYGVKK